MPASTLVAVDGEGDRVVGTISKSRMDELDEYLAPTHTAMIDLPRTIKIALRGKIVIAHARFPSRNNFRSRPRSPVASRWLEMGVKISARLCRMFVGYSASFSPIEK